MQLIGLARLGRDAEAPRTAGSTVVTNLSLAFNYGQKDQQTGNRPTQWVDASLWGPQAERLQQYLTKGKLLCVTLDDVHIETYQGRNGEGHKLVGKVSKLDFAGGNEQRQEGPAPAPSRAPAPAPAARNAYADARGKQQPTGAGSGFDDMDSDIPFN